MSSPTFASEIERLRAIHAGACLRAREVWAAATDLAMARVWLPADWALHEVASAIFYNSGYDAMERYETLGEFKSALLEDLTVAWPTRTVHDGKSCYLVRPLMRSADDSSTYLMHLGLGGMNGMALTDLSALRVEPLRPGRGAPSGLTDDEMEAVRRHHQSSTLSLVNLMRKLHTSLHYVDRATSSERFAAVPHDEAIPSMVSRMLGLTRMPAFPPASEYFGTDADRTNVLRELDVEAAFAEFGAPRVDPAVAT